MNAKGFESRVCIQSSLLFFFFFLLFFFFFLGSSGGRSIRYVRTPFAPDEPHGAGFSWLGALLSSGSWQSFSSMHQVGACSQPALT